MNPSDRLEEIKQRLEGTWDCSVPNHEVEWLLAKIVEQDREIERLRDIEWKWLNQDQTPGEIRAEEAEADCKRAGRKIDELAGMVQKTKAEREKLIGALKKIRRDILEPDKIYIHLSRVLGSELEK